MKLKWVPSERGGVEARAGGYTLHVHDCPSLADMMARRPGWEWSVHRHGWGMPVGSRDPRAPHTTCLDQEAAQEAAEVALARLLAEDEGLRALLEMVGPVPGYVSYFGQYIDALRSPPGDMPPSWRVWEVGSRKPGGGNSPHVRYVNAVSPEQAREFADLGDDARVLVLDASAYFATSNNAEHLARRVSELCARVAELEAAARWIPVGESLPDERCEVLVWDGRDSGEAFLSFGSWWPPDGSSIDGVTHWRPLPAGPEVEK